MSNEDKKPWFEDPEQHVVVVSTECEHAIFAAFSEASNWFLFDERETDTSYPFRLLVKKEAWEERDRVERTEIKAYLRGVAKGYELAKDW